MLSVVNSHQLQFIFSCYLKMIRLPGEFAYLAVINMSNCTYFRVSKGLESTIGERYVPIFTWGFVRSNAVAYVLAAFSTEAPPFWRHKACCRGLTALPCCSADRAVRRKGATVRTNAGIMIWKRKIEGERRGRRDGECMMVLKLDPKSFLAYLQGSLRMHVIMLPLDYYYPFWMYKWAECSPRVVNFRLRQCTIYVTLSRCIF